MLPETVSDGRVGYVLKRYPRLSETFIVTELLAREAAGEDIAIASLGFARDPRFHPGIAAVRAPVTWMPEIHGTPALWEVLRAAHRELPGLPAVLPELMALPPAEAVQVLHVAGWVRSAGITHLHAHFATLATTVARLASALTGVPYSFTAHAKDIFHDSVDRVALRAKLADAHHVVTVSEFNARWLRERFGDAAARVHAVHNGLDVAGLPFSEPRVRGGRVAFVGRLVEKKGLADLIDAIALLRERGRPVPLDVVGGGVLDGALREQAQVLGLGDLVTFHGPLPSDRVRQVLREASVFAAPCVHASDGDRDGLPTVLLEAMAAGTPCVSTPVTGIPEAIVHGRTGLLVGEREPDALADAVLRLLDDAELRVRLAIAARAHLEERFDSRVQAAELARLRRAHASVTAQGLTAAPAAAGMEAGR
ncbi:colanic acid biosynthesis glycosyltransferase WcaL [Streptomyces spinoverrucosus]|uniref:D-inositol 3-phosphate glycosyltransferase n=1 Tax=Streptomyces spinoverrucosus TaxID=284043 RepID=A0A4Y3VBC1_9ACTN|nr:glycosyltransferase family 4 protein [Streptomyces spinoverrucosus]GEC03615.1 colanic acid biosynthesis glycosyltransferase WcaL [Streptomyces spinoverrucosus]GHB51310.1 colanic acid biosynthesis glycosyltransferase WcaL [Streptomyces spinoverrucosus]